MDYPSQYVTVRVAVSLQRISNLSRAVGLAKALSLLRIYANYNRLRYLSIPVRFQYFSLQVASILDIWPKISTRLEANGHSTDRQIYLISRVAVRYIDFLPSRQVLAALISQRITLLRVRIESRFLGLSKQMATLLIRRLFAISKNVLDYKII